MLAGSLVAQDDYDYVDRNSFSIEKTSLDLKGYYRQSASSLRPSMDVENHCGSNYANVSFDLFYTINPIHPENILIYSKNN